MTAPVVELDHVTVARPGGPVVFDHFSWTVRENEAWAVVGAVGSGKTTLAEVLLGRLPVRGGEVRWPLLDRLRAAGRVVNYPSEVVRHVAFKEESRLFTYAGHYYQQRFEFADADEPLTLEQFLRSGTPATDEEIRSAAARLGVEAQLPLSFIKLSNGQTRRARIARALLARPELLILDDPFLGLDAAGRAGVGELLGGLVRDGLRLVLICRGDAVPGWITHIQECGTGDPTPNPLPHRERGLVPTPPSFPGKGAGGLGSEPLIQLRHVTVSHGGRPILADISWTVRAGERWAVLGPNGSGKTTLLSLLCGDHPQAYANDIRLFGRRRGTGESIWDVKRNVGLVSPEFHLYFPAALPAGRAAATGFFDTVADQPTTPEQDARVRQLFAEVGITHLADRSFRQLSTGEQRLVLLVRAVVKRPPLLILDEPFQGLDESTAARVRNWLDAGFGPDQAVLFVTHDPAELPPSVTHTLRLDGGRVMG